jgi:hypothetical protein
MVTGIVQSKQCHLEAMARKAADGAKVESRVKRYSRSLQNEQVDEATYYLPYIEAVLAGLAEQGSLVVVMDGREVGRNCLALMIRVIYHNRALPLGWVVVTGNKGHFPETAHLTLLNKITALIPEEADVIFLGDGEFDEIDLQAARQALGWHDGCCTAHNTWVVDADDDFSLDQLALDPRQWLELADQPLGGRHRCLGNPDRRLDCRLATRHDFHAGSSKRRRLHPIIHRQPSVCDGLSDRRSPAPAIRKRPDVLAVYLNWLFRRLRLNFGSSFRKLFPRFLGRAEQDH